jgi:predicted Zn-dependent protease
LLRIGFGHESLEGRELLSGLGTDYTYMGGKWSNTTITYSIAPDGVPWAANTNTINATLDAQFGGTSWQAAISKALQVWAAATDLNFVQVSDGAYGFNAPGQAQGDPRFGDIRFGADDFGNKSIIARTYGPPTGGGTEAGDVELNTEFNYAPGGVEDLETVLIHEIGHSLGLGESPQPASVMYSYYSGTRQSLSAYDVEGIQSLYGPPAPDAYQGSGQAISAANAYDVSSSLGSQNQAVLSASLASIGDVEYFSVVTPALQGSTLRVTAAANGFSQLSPRLTVIDPATGAVLGSQGDANLNSDNPQVLVANAVAGKRYLIEVTGSANSNYAVGAYRLVVAFQGGTSTAPPSTPIFTPAPPSTPTPTPAPTPAPVSTAPAPVVTISNTSFATATELGALGLKVVNNQTLPTGSTAAFFTFEVAQPGVVLLASANTEMLVGDVLGRPVVAGTGLIGFAAPVAGARYFVIFLSPNSQPVSSYGFAINDIASATGSVSAQSAALIPLAPAPAETAKKKTKK